MPRPRVLVLGGVDPSGGAGITADARVLELHGCHALTVATCDTVQNRFGFVAVRAAEPRWLQATLRAALADGPLHAVKLGLFADAETLAVSRDGLASLRVPVVVDPVLSATAGGYVAADALVAAYRKLIACVHPILTPNHAELRALAPGGVAELLALGCSAVLDKDGHGTGPVVEDRLHTHEEVVVLRHLRADCGAVHGTGCALAAAVAGRLAHGHPIAGAAAAASTWLGACLAAMASPAAAESRPFVPLPVQIQKPDSPRTAS